MNISGIILTKEERHAGLVIEETEDFIRLFVSGREVSSWPSLSISLKSIRHEVEQQLNWLKSGITFAEVAGGVGQLAGLRVDPCMPALLSTDAILSGYTIETDGSTTYLRHRGRKVASFPFSGPASPEAVNAFIRADGSRS